MTSPRTHRRTTAQPDFFPPVPDGAIPTQRRADHGVHRAATTKPGRGRMVAGVALMLVAAVGAVWLLLSAAGSSETGAATESALSDLMLPLDGDSPRISGRIPEGTVNVGHEVEPGTYRTAGPSPLAGPAGCRWQIGDGARGTAPLVTSGTATGPTTVTLRPGDGSFTSSGCQNWVQLG